MCLGDIATLTEGMAWETRRGSSCSSASRVANRGGCHRGSSVSPGDRQEQSSSQQNQQPQFQCVSGQSSRGQDSNRSQGNRGVQTNESRDRGGVSIDHNVSRGCGGAGHWQNTCPSTPAAQTRLCFRVQN